MYKPQITRAKLYFTIALLIISSIALIYAIRMSEAEKETVFDEIIWDDTEITIKLNASTKYMIAATRLNHVQDEEHSVWLIEIYYQENSTAPIYPVLETKFDPFPVNVTLTWSFHVNETKTYYLMITNNIRCYVQTARFHVTIYKIIE